MTARAPQVAGLGMALMLVLSIPRPATAQRVAELTGGIGISVVDLETYSGRALWDSNRINYQGSVLVLPVRFGKLLVGGEAGYQYFFWYTSREIYYAPERIEGPSAAVEPAAIHVLGVARVDLDNVFVDVGAGVYRFAGGGSRFGFAGGFGYDIKVTAAFSVPIKFRADVVFASHSTIVAPSAVVGMAFKF